MTIRSGIGDTLWLVWKKLKGVARVDMPTIER